MFGKRTSREEEQNTKKKPCKKMGKGCTPVIRNPTIHSESKTKKIEKTVKTSERDGVHLAEGKKAIYRNNATGFQSNETTVDSKIRGNDVHLQKKGGR